jgi:GT2 family glycosyltransferase
VTAADSVCVVVPCYNYANYLREAVASVQRQTLPPAELILVDDGSTDDSLDVMHALAKEIDGFAVQVLHQANQGVAAARNHGAEMAHSRLLLFLDADDVLLPHTLGKTTAALLRHPEAAIAYGSAVFHYSGMNATPGGPREGEIASVREYSFDHLLEDNFIFMESLLRREAFERAEGFDSRMHVAEDWELWIDVCKHGWTAVCVSEALFVYRLHEGSRRNVTERTLFEGMAEIQAIHPELYKPERRQWLLVAARGQEVRDAQDSVLSRLTNEKALVEAELDAGIAEARRVMDQWRRLVKATESPRVRTVALRLVDAFDRRGKAIEAMRAAPAELRGRAREQLTDAERQAAGAFRGFLDLGVELGELTEASSSKTKKL